MQSRRAVVAVLLGTAWVTSCGEARSSHDARVIDQRQSQASEDLRCECIPEEEWTGYGSCQPSFSWGCRRDPTPWTTPAPADCWRVGFDPHTRCLKPVIVSGCLAGGCGHVDPPPAPDCSVSDLNQSCGPKGATLCASPQGACLAFTESAGLCTCHCTVDDPATAASEDSCPDPKHFACGRLPMGDGTRASLCVRRCRPERGTNPCPAPLACHPGSGDLVGLPGQAVCLMLACTDDDACTPPRRCDLASGACL